MIKLCLDLVGCCYYLCSVIRRIDTTTTQWTTIILEIYGLDLVWLCSFPPYRFNQPLDTSLTQYSLLDIRWLPLAWLWLLGWPPTKIRYYHNPVNYYHYYRTLWLGLGWPMFLPSVSFQFLQLWTHFYYHTWIIRNNNSSILLCVQ
jgi:hypothetical protein